MTTSPKRRAILRLSILAAVPFAAENSNAKTKPENTVGYQPSFGSAISALQEKASVKIGLFAIDTESGSTLDFNADERFNIASTFKLLLAAAVLKRVEEGSLHLDQSVAFGQADMVDWAPTTSKYLAKGKISIEALCEAAVVPSDNAAGNLLLRVIGGPPALTAFMRSIGDTVTRLDRYELELNENRPGDPRDTTSARAMAMSVRRLLTTDLILGATSRERLSQWVKDGTIGLHRLRAGLPVDWVSGDKSGSGRRGGINDVAVGWPKGRKPVVIACYQSSLTQATEWTRPAEKTKLEAVLAEVGRLVSRELGR